MEAPPIILIRGDSNYKFFFLSTFELCAHVPIQLKIQLSRQLNLVINLLLALSLPSHTNCPKDAPKRPALFEEISVLVGVMERANVFPLVQWYLIWLPVGVVSLCSCSSNPSSPDTWYHLSLHAASGSVTITCTGSNVIIRECIALGCLGQIIAKNKHVSQLLQY